MLRGSLVEDQMYINKDFSRENPILTRWSYCWRRIFAADLGQETLPKRFQSGDSISKMVSSKDESSSCYLSPSCCQGGVCWCIRITSDAVWQHLKIIWKHLKITWRLSEDLKTSRRLIVRVYVLSLVVLHVIVSVGMFITRLTHCRSTVTRQCICRIEFGPTERLSDRLWTDWSLSCHVGTRQSPCRVGQCWA